MVPPASARAYTSRGLGGAAAFREARYAIAGIREGGGEGGQGAARIARYAHGAIDVSILGGYPQRLWCEMSTLRGSARASFQQRLDYRQVRRVQKENHSSTLYHVMPLVIL